VNLIYLLAVSGNVFLLGEVNRLALELMKTLVGLLTKKLLSLVAVTFVAVIPDSLELLVLGFALILAFKMGLNREADLVVLFQLVLVTVVLLGMVEASERSQLVEQRQTGRLAGFVVGNLVTVNRALLVLVTVEVGVMVAITISIRLITVAFFLLVALVPVVRFIRVKLGIAQFVIFTILTIALLVVLVFVLAFNTFAAGILSVFTILTLALVVLVATSIELVTTGIVLVTESIVLVLARVEKDRFRIILVFIARFIISITVGVSVFTVFTIAFKIKVEVLVQLVRIAAGVEAVVLVGLHASDIIIIALFIAVFTIAF